MKSGYSEKKAYHFFNNLTNKDKADIEKYKKYWSTITPYTNQEIFRRYLFAFCSVHTSWESNVKGYQYIKDFKEWIHNPLILRNRLIESGVGLYNNRTNYIMQFSNMFWNNPEDFKINTFNHAIARNRIVNTIPGLGHAKVSFALEMIKPLEAQVLCGDIHHLRLYNLENLNYKTKLGQKIYEKMENNWLENCKQVDIPPFMVRQLFWDRLQNQPDCRYWSHVFE